MKYFKKLELKVLFPVPYHIELLNKPNVSSYTLSYSILFVIFLKCTCAVSQFKYHSGFFHHSRTKASLAFHTRALMISDLLPNFNLFLPHISYCTSKKHYQNIV